MRDVVELTLSRSVNVTDTSHIRTRVAARSAGGSPSVELVHFNVFVLCVEGRGHHMVDFVDHEMHPGAAIWIRPGQIQQWDPDGGFDAVVVVFDSAAVPDLPLHQRLAAGATAATLGGLDHAHQLVTWLAADLEAHGDEHTGAAVVAVLLRLFARGVATTWTADVSPQRRELARLFIASVEANLDRRAVGWHAARIGASTRTVARATADVLGQSPKEVVDNVVMLEAQRRLAWSTDDVSVIARSLRFTDSSNFSKFFRARAGVTPSAFRAGVAAG